MKKTLMKLHLFYIAAILLIYGCNTSDNAPTDETTSEESMYFPPIDSDIWETTSTAHWNPEKLEELNVFLKEEKSKSLMILVNGKIAIETYYNGHNANDTWQWNSAGKTLVTATIGIAEQEGHLDIQDPVSDYLGTNWTSTTLEQENLITPYHLLTMTSGLNDEKNLVTKANMTYLTDAGTRWSYSNIFQKLINIVDESTSQDFRTYFNNKLGNKIGMIGSWNYGLIFKIYHSNTRSMARFGLLALNQGLWDDEQIINQNYFTSCTSTSQSLNPAYGYLWWLNGKDTYKTPGNQQDFNGSLVPNAPADMYAAMGAAEQRIYVIPTKNMVIVRTGEASNLGDNDFALSEFDNLFWEKLNQIWE